MTHKKPNNRTRSECGYAVIGFLVVALVSALLIYGALDNTATNSRTVLATKVRAERFYESEETLGKSTSWLRLYSKDLLSPFTRKNFYKSFVRTDPSLGKNEVTYPLPTKLKLVGTKNSAILANSKDLAISAYPKTFNIETALAFDAVGEFAAAELGSGLVRITLLDAIAEHPGKDYGPPPNPAPGTDFYPIFRIDAMTGTDRGMHVYAHLIGELDFGGSAGFYGETHNSVDSVCDSYDSSLGLYGGKNKNADCSIGSNKKTIVAKHATIYGSAMSNDKLKVDGEVCGDFDPGCPNPGDTCSGETCEVPFMEPVDPWSVACPMDQGKLDIKVDTVLKVTSDLPIDKCWGKVTIKRGITLTLVTTDFPYFFKSVKFENKNTSRIVISPTVADESVSLYLGSVSGNKVNGRQLVNTTKRPAQFLLYHLGTKALQFEGNTDLLLGFISPNAAVKIVGKYQFFGAAQVRHLSIKKDVVLHYDESFGLATLTDVNFRVRQIAQAYR